MNYRKQLLITLVILIFLIGAFFSAYVYFAIFTENTSFEKASVSVYIPTSDEEERLSKSLFPYLKNSNSFLKLAKQKGYLRNIRGGKYEITKGMSNNDIINVLRSKPSTVKVSFNNQETLADLAARVSIEIEADSTSLINSFLETSFLIANEFNTDNALAMYLPNTYDFFWNTSAEGFRGRMLEEYHKFWNSDRIKRAQIQGLTPIEVINLAAVVHKESVKADERPRVAAVYLNRIKIGMRLQADPTVIYSIKKTSGNFDQQIKRVLYKDLKINSLYNTYMNKGIPPGPIFMPDINAIEAVLYPEKHTYLYFVADAENFGYHIFSKSLKEHNKNKRQYVNWINSKKVKR